MVPEPGLVSAARTRDLEAVRRHLGEGADVEARAANGLTALMWAVRADDLVMTALLLGAGARIDGGDARGWTALAWAAFDDALAGVRALLDAGASVRASGSIALHVAVMRERVRIIAALIDAGADLSSTDSNERTPVEQAALGGVAAVVAAVLRGPNPQVALDRALVAAAAEGHVVAVEKLLDAGADTTFATARGNTALGIARKRRRKEVVAVLVARGATVAKTASVTRAVPAPPDVRDRRGSLHAELAVLLTSTSAARRRSAARKMGALGDAAFEHALVAALARELEDKRAWEGQREMARAIGVVSSDASVSAWLEQLFVELRFESTVVPDSLGRAALRVGVRAGQVDLDRLLTRTLDEIPAKAQQLAACSGVLEAAVEADLRVGASVGRRLAAFLHEPGELPRHSDGWLESARAAWALLSKKPVAR